MSIDRPAILRQAEKLLRQGKLDQAIAEYVRLVEDQPRDWNTANLLGDLYVRAGRTDEAIQQFSRIAENLATEGFFPRASALYKKILKLKPDSDHALVQAGELAVTQGLLADARMFLSTAINGRRSRGDTRGALELSIRLGGLDRNDVDARMNAVRARIHIEDVPGALQELHDIASMLTEEGRDSDALVPLREISTLDPGNAQAKRELARILVAQGQVADAAPFLTPDAVGTDPALLLVAIDMHLRSNQTAPALQLADSLLRLDDAPRAGLRDVALAVAGQHPEAAYAVLDRLVGAAIEASDWAAAAALLQEFIGRTSHHVLALTRLVEVCVDGGLQEPMAKAQALLADAYLNAGAASQARYVAEDLLTREPWERAHWSRLRAALEAEGDADPDRSIADWVADTQALGMDADAFGDQPVPTPQPSLVTASEAAAETAAPPVPVQPTAAPHTPARRVNPHAIDLDLALGTPAPPAQAPPAPAPPSLNVEEDLSVVLDQINSPQAAASAPPPPNAAPADATDIESVFAQFRDEAAQKPAEESADVAFTRGRALFEAGDLQASIEPLRTAARAPHRRHAAASLLARVYEQQNRTPEAIEWLGHAVDAPVVNAAERFDTMFRLADLLESAGETASALAVCLELQADAGDYQDVAARIARLSRQGGG